MAMLRGGFGLSTTTVRLSVLVFVGITILLSLPRRHIVPKAFFLQTSTLASAASPSATAFHTSNDDYWKAVLQSLEDARPQCDTLSYTPHAFQGNETKHQPLIPSKPHPHNLNLTDQVEKELMRAHYDMRRAAFRLGQKLPYVKDTTGIVVTSSPRQQLYFIISLRMLRSTGNQLPVELFLADQSEYNSTICEEFLPPLNARCVVMSQIFAPKLEHFQYKIFAMLLSSFQNVLFLDSDSFPIHDPTPLFSSRPFTSHGMVIWPDVWANTVSAHFYHIAGIPEVPVSARIASETGQVLYDKSRHKESLLMSVYYNYYGPSHYYAMLSQGAPGPGDKDTFIQGAMAVDLPFYTVKTPPHPLGRHGGAGGQGFHMVGMGQKNPVDDYYYAPPVPNHLHTKENWDDYDAAHGNNANSLDPAKPKVFFIHQMLAKLRPGMILRPELHTHKAEDGGWRRMWVEQEGVTQTFGYDAEAVLWEILEQASCVDRVEPEACETLKEYRKAVFEV